MSPQALRELRERLQLTKTEACRLTGVDRRRWQRWESGQEAPPLASVVRLLQLMLTFPDVRQALETMAHQGEG